jgi:type I restriction enzyme S subunit
MREGWNSFNLGEVVEIKYGKDHKKLGDGNYPLYGSGGVMRYVDSYLYDDESVLIPRKGTLSNLFYLNEPFSTVDTMFWTKINKSITTPRFLYYLLKTYDLASLDEGAAIPSLTTKALNVVKINLPPLETQRKIAKILSNYDDLIENNLKRIKILEEMAQQTYEEWFVRMRFPSYETAKINETTGLPEGWERVKLGEVCNFSQGLQVPIEKQFTQFSNELIRFIRIVDVTQNTNDIRYIESPKSLNQFVHFKDVFMVRYGAPQVVTNYHGIIANNFFRININDENKLKRKFLFSFLNRNEIKENLLAMSVSATMPAISFKSFSTLDIILPEIEVQAKFHKYVDTTYDLILNLQNQNQRLREARDILLPRLMMGMVEV